LDSLKDASPFEQACWMMKACRKKCPVGKGTSQIHVVQ